MFVKRCMICKRTSENCPEDIFICAPSEEETRQKWLKIAGSNAGKSAAVYCCGNHFDLEKDIINWFRYISRDKDQPMRLKLRTGVVPHRNIPVILEPPPVNMNMLEEVHHESEDSGVPDELQNDSNSSNFHLNMGEIKDENENDDFLINNIDDDTDHLASMDYIEDEQQMKPNPCKNSKSCLNSCKNIKEDQRENIYNQYWILPNLEERQRYLANFIQVGPVKRKRRKESSTRNRTIAYSVQIPPNNTKIRICRQFLIATLCITVRTLRNVISKFKIIDKFSSNERTAMVYKKITARDKDAIDKFIQNLPADTLDYYCSSTCKKYLPADIKSYASLYKMYVTEQKEKQRFFANYDKFMKIFKTEYNLGIRVHRPPIINNRCGDCGELCIMPESNKKHVLYLPGERYKTEENKNIKSSGSEIRIKNEFLMKQNHTKRTEDSLSFDNFNDQSSMNTTPTELKPRKIKIKLEQNISSFGNTNEVPELVYLQNQSDDGPSPTKKRSHSGNYVRAITDLATNMKKMQKELMQEFFRKQEELMREEHKFQKEQDQLLLNSFEEQTTRLLDSVRDMLSPNMPIYPHVVYVSEDE